MVDGLKCMLEVMMRARVTWGCVKKHEVHVKSILGLGYLCCHLKNPWVLAFGDAAITSN